MNKQISISYNGHRTQVTCMPDNVYYVQITSTPYLISQLKNEDGTNTWIEIDGGRQTELSRTIGNLIEKEPEYDQPGL